MGLDDDKYHVNNNGFTLLQVVGTLLILSLAGSAGLTLLNMETQSVARLEKKELLFDLLRTTVNEVQVRSLNALPNQGSCLSRDYTLSGEPKGELSGTVGQSPCNEFTPGEIGIRITILVEPIASANATFDPSEFLKLPVTADHLRRVRVVAGSRVGKNASAQPHIGVTTFRRGG